MFNKHFGSLHIFVRVTALALTSLAFLAIPALAGSNGFSKTEIQFLYGHNFHLGGAGFGPPGSDTFDDTSERGTITLDHLSTWEYGDNFFFLDLTNDFNTPTNTIASTNDKTLWYGEFYEHLSLAKMMGQKRLDWGLIKDIGPGVGINAGTDVVHMLAGARAVLDIPYFNFVSLAAYYYDNVEDPFNRDLDETFQLTAVWDTVFKPTERVHIRFKGFIDYIGDQSVGPIKVREQLQIVPQVRLDVGNLLLGKPGRVEAGIEYFYWQNKFGTELDDDQTIQALIAFKLH